MKRALVIVALMSARVEAQPQGTIYVSLPSIDGRTGVEVGAERFLLARRLGVVATLGMRHTATADYSGVAVGAGIEARWYWRGRELWTDLPAGAMVGWFLAGRGDLALAHTYDRADDRSLGTALVLGASGAIGYRLVPWRGLAITGKVSLGLRNGHDLRGRLPPWTMGELGVGLEVGWMF